MSFYSKYFKRYKLPFLTAIICVTMEAICDLLGPTLMSNIINLGIDGANLSSVYYWGGLMLIVTGLGACFAITRNILASKVSQRVGADLRYDLFRKILYFSENGSDKIESGSLITRMTNDTSQIVQFINGIMRIFLKAPITCIGSIVLATILNFRLSLIIYGVVIIVVGLIVVSMKLSYPRFYKLQKSIDKVNSVVQEYLIGVRLVKAFSTYNKEEEKFGEANNTLMKNSVSSQMIITIVSPLITFTVGIGTVIVIWIGSKLFSLNLANPGDITAFTIYMAQILTSLIMITNIFNTFVRTKASTARIKEIFNCEDDFTEKGKVSELKGKIEFKNVTFSYPNGSGIPAINDLSFSLNAGEKLAIIGPTGSGKSTIVWLLLKFYDVNKGEILIDGKNIKDKEVDLLRRSISIVPQKPMLFSGSISDNIKWGDKNASEEEIKESAKKAEASFIYNMPEEFQSTLGSGGVNLSGGQKQRISIARGIIKNAKILILDDATSALDAVTESKVRDNINSYMKDETVITITQRCGTAMASDKILVMDNGENVGFGTHSELMKSCDIYRDIYRTQIESSKEA
ncbi:ABC transporter ATP-binding protein [Clostridium sp. LIBA-8841]|uniref:ABC transporter ATP-binding protein n=1 Tax=Clostridium sp. LIBA-8841 TaxID=2987530 RepID=UPI002AC72E08|nr:ABC transporter ATP-binding protein [Clostridium sp. LIBA-8841]MDZ5252175.1 ABC transporter ATP-binding protein/permease [Clostridium sp. LIBA-8841]